MENETPQNNEENEGKCTHSIRMQMRFDEWTAIDDTKWLNETRIFDLVAEQKWKIIEKNKINNDR